MPLPADWLWAQPRSNRIGVLVSSPSPASPCPHPLAVIGAVDYIARPQTEAEEKEGTWGEPFLWVFFPQVNRAPSSSHQATQSGGPVRVRCSPQLPPVLWDLLWLKCLGISQWLVHSPLPSHKDKAQNTVSWYIRNVNKETGSWVQCPSYSG